MALFNWNHYLGLLIEPNVQLYQQLKALDRKVATINTCVAITTMPQKVVLVDKHKTQGNPVPCSIGGFNLSL